MSFTCYSKHSETANSRHNVNTCRDLRDILSHCLLSIPELSLLLQILWKCNPWCIWQPLSSQHHFHHCYNTKINRTRHTTNHILCRLREQMARHAVFQNNTIMHRLKTGLTWWWHTDFPHQSSYFCTYYQSRHRCEVDSHTGPVDINMERDWWTSKGCGVYNRFNHTLEGRGFFFV